MGMGLHYSPFLLLIVQLLKLTWQMDMLSFLLPCVCIDLREGMVIGVRYEGEGVQNSTKKNRSGPHESPKTDPCMYTETFTG